MTNKEIVLKASKLAKKNNQALGRSGDLFITVEQLAEILKVKDLK